VLTEQQKARLRKVARSPYHPDLGKENDKLLAVINELQIETSSAFLNEGDLPLRRFFHKPVSVIPFLTSEKDKL
jgi:hypothetical protein